MVSVFGVEVLHFILIITTIYFLSLAIWHAFSSFSKFGSATKGAFGLKWFLFAVIFMDIAIVLHLGEEIYSHNQPGQEETFDNFLINHKDIAFIFPAAICVAIAFKSLLKTAEEFSLNGKS